MPRPRLMAACGPPDRGREGAFRRQPGRSALAYRRESMKPRETIAMHCARSDDGDLDKNHTTMSKRSAGLL